MASVILVKLEMLKIKNEGSVTHPPQSTCCLNSPIWCSVTMYPRLVVSSCGLYVFLAGRPTMHRGVRQLRC